jgi:hypothetical protein
MLAIERDWARVVLSGFAGSDRGFVPGEVDYFYAARRFTQAGSQKAALGLRFAVLMAMTAPLWMWGKLRTLKSYAPEERSRLLDEMLRHRIFFVRELCLLLKLVACMAIFRSSEARARAGYDRPKAAKRSLPTVSAREEAA